MRVNGDFTEQEIREMAADWDRRTASWRAWIDKRPRTGKVCSTCEGHGLYPRLQALTCLRCDGKGVDPKW